MASEPVSGSRPSLPRLAARGFALALARLRFLLLVGGVLALIAYWPTLRYAWERLTRPDKFPVAVSSETEYWCPMCPGVVSDWPSKCPVCHMTLVRRLRGEMTPLPDGVVARVQLSPYRVMLAGIHATTVEYQPLELVIIAGGRIEDSRKGSAVLAGEIFAHESPLLAEGLTAEVRVDDFPGETFAGRVASVTGGRDARVRVVVDDPGSRLRPAAYAEARVRLPAASLEAQRSAALRRWRDQTAVEMLAAGPSIPSGLGSLLSAAVDFAYLQRGLVLAVPETAVVDTGERQVVFLETMAGVYDAVEVRLGRRCASQYPVLAGLEPGQRVVTAGSVLLDAETRLNPSVAAGYFGAGARGAAPPPPGVLSPEDRLQAQKQKICPVTGEPLDSMGGPVRVLVGGKPVFICCEGCREPLLKSPAKYLPRISK